MNTPNPQRTLGPILKSNKLYNVCYDIRGPVLKAADQLESDGHTVLKLNIGNPAPWGFNACLLYTSDAADE